MSQSKRTKYLLQGAALLGLAGVVGMSIAATPSANDLKADAASASSKQATAERGDDTKLASNTYARATSVRRNAALADQDLAALGLNQEQAEAVLGRLVDWCETNGAQLDEAENAYHSSRLAVNELERKIRVGLATDREIAEMAEMRSATNEAQSALVDVRGQVAAYAMQAPGLPEGAAASWAKINELTDRVRGDLRYLPELDEQRLDSLRADALRDAIELEESLRFAEQQQLAEIRQRKQANLSGVQAATEVVMPDPDAVPFSGDVAGSGDFIGD